jgi:pentatricopeptide repeat protein
MKPGMGLTRGWILLLVLVLLASLSVRGQTIQEAMRLYQRGEPDQTQRLLLESSLESERNPEYLLLLAKTEPRGNLSQEHLKEVLEWEEEGSSSEQAYLLACKYEFSKDMHLATVDLVDGLENKYSRSQILPEALWISGSSLLAAQKPDLAQLRFNEVLTRFPGSDWAPWAQLSQGDCFLEIRDFDRAASAYNRILEYHRDSEAFAFALSGLIECYGKSGDSEKALLYYNLLKERFPQWMESTTLPPREEKRSEESEEQGKAERLAGVRYTIQLGVFGVAENALRLKAQFEKQGHPVLIKTKVIGGKKYSVVQLGSFVSYQEASDLKKTLEAQTGDSYRVVIR